MIDTEKYRNRKESLSIRINEIKIEISKRTNFIISLFVILFIFYGLICNYLMYDADERVIWIYKTFLQIHYGLPIYLLFFTCMWLTYSQNVSLNGLRKSFLLVGWIEVISILWYWFLFGFSLTPFQLILFSLKGYLNLFILFFITFTGSLAGALLKRRRILKLQKVYNSIEHKSESRN